MRWPRTIAAALLLATPAVLAFASGGYFEGARLWTGLVVWVAVGLLAVAGALRRPGRAGWLLVAGTAALAVWTTASIAWSPLRDPALADAERVWVYAGFVILAVSLLGGRAARFSSPALAAGTVIVGGYALATRLLPSLVPSEHSTSAGARLDQPLTYWNGLGAVLAIGIVLLVHLGADETRPRLVRRIAFTAVPLNGLALYLTFSRGSLGALAVGLLVLVGLQRNRLTLALVVAGVGLSGAIAAFASAFAAVDSLAGDVAARRDEGLIVLAALVVACGLAAVAEHVIASGVLERVRVRSAVVAAGLAVAVAVAGAVVVVGRNPKPPARDVPSQGAKLPTTRARLSTLRSNRYDYWKIAVRGFGDHPLIGVGAHGFQQLWLHERDIRESAQDAHSLYLETATELGIVGVAFLVVLLIGVFKSLRAALAARTLRVQAVGWTAASACWLVHAGVDWDWEMPTVTLIFLTLVCASAAATEQLVDRDRG